MNRRSAFDLARVRPQRTVGLSLAILVLAALTACSSGGDDPAGQPDAIDATVVGYDGPVQDVAGFSFRVDEFVVASGSVSEAGNLDLTLQTPPEGALYTSADQESLHTSDPEARIAGIDGIFLIEDDTRIGRLVLASSSRAAQGTDVRAGDQLGYFFYSDRSTSFTLDGAGLSGTVQLDAGWNLVVQEYTGEGDDVTSQLERGDLDDLTWYYFGVA